MEPLNPDTFREAIFRAKLMIYAVKTANPDKEKILDHMKDLIEQVVNDCDQLLA